MGEVGKLSKVRFYAETTFGGGAGTGDASDHAVDSISGPGPDRAMIEHDKILQRVFVEIDDDGSDSSARCRGFPARVQ